MPKTNGAGPNGSASNGTQVTFLEAIKQAMFEEMERDPAVVLIGEDVGVYGGPFHSANPEMYFVHTPGRKVIYPSTPYDAKGLLKAAVRDNNPVLFFEHKFLYRRIKGEVPADDYTVPIGKAAVRREGKHLTIISYAAMMHASLEAAEALAKEGM